MRQPEPHPLSGIQATDQIGILPLTIKWIDPTQRLVRARQHKCVPAVGCHCSGSMVEPSEDCPVHMGAPVRGYCGHFISEAALKRAWARWAEAQEKTNA